MLATLHMNMLALQRIFVRYVSHEIRHSHLLGPSSWTPVLQVSAEHRLCWLGHHLTWGRTQRRLPSHTEQHRHCQDDWEYILGERERHRQRERATLRAPRLLDHSETALAGVLVGRLYLPVRPVADRYASFLIVWMNWLATMITDDAALFHSIESNVSPTTMLARSTRWWIGSWSARSSAVTSSAAYPSGRYWRPMTESPHNTTCWARRCELIGASILCWWTPWWFER